LSQIKKLIIDAEHFDIQTIEPDILAFPALHTLILKAVGIEADDGQEENQFKDGSLKLRSLSLEDVGDRHGSADKALTAASLTWLLRLAGPNLQSLSHALRDDYPGTDSGMLGPGAVAAVRTAAPKLKKISLELTRDNVNRDMEDLWELLTMTRLTRLTLRMGYGGTNTERGMAIKTLREAYDKLNVEARAKVDLQL
jgi:hypothetical protein